MVLYKLTTFFLILCVLCLALPACTPEDNDDRYTGILANEGIVSSIRQEMIDKENSLLANDGDVFWTESGKLWHKTPDCSYLANSKTVLHGTVEEAKFEGKEKPCSRCASEPNDSIYDSLKNNEYKIGDVFFTKEGDVWHKNINCSLIAGAEGIYYADEETAKYLGKSTACKECENK